MKFISLIILIVASAFSVAETKLKSMDCTYKSGPRAEYKIASVEYVRKSTLKSIWLAPSQEADHRETIFADDCVKEKGGAYVCSNPVYDDAYGATFDGETLSVYISAKKPTVYECSEKK